MSTSGRIMKGECGELGTLKPWGSQLVTQQFFLTGSCVEPVQCYSRAPQSIIYHSKDCRPPSPRCEACSLKWPPPSQEDLCEQQLALLSATKSQGSDNSAILHRGHLCGWRGCSSQLMTQVLLRVQGQLWSCSSFKGPGTRQQCRAINTPLPAILSISALKPH